MPTSAINHYVTPDSTAKPVVAEDFKKIVDQLMLGDVMYFANEAERTATFATLGFAPPAGARCFLINRGWFEYWHGADWVPEPGTLIKRGSRGTSSATTTTTEREVLRVDSIPLKAGQGYRIGGTTYMLSSSANGDGVLARLRANTAGNATIASTVLAELLIQTLTSQGSGSGKLERFYFPTVDETLSVLLSVVRIQGSGNVSITATAGVIDLEIVAIGKDPGNTGVPL